MGWRCTELRYNLGVYIFVGSGIDAYECSLANFNLGSKAGGGGGGEGPIRMLPQPFCFLPYISRSFDLSKQSRVLLLSHRFHFVPDPPGRGSSHRLLSTPGPSSAKWFHRTPRSLLHRRSPASPRIGIVASLAYAALPPDAILLVGWLVVGWLIPRRGEERGGGLVCTKHSKSFCICGL